MLEITKPGSKKSIDQLLKVGQKAELSQTGEHNHISPPAQFNVCGFLQIAEELHSVGGERFVKKPPVEFLENPNTCPAYARVTRVHPMK